MKVLDRIEPVEVYTTASRSKWGSGPWDSEPDKVVWVDAATGFSAMARRNTFGAWCGYVGVPETHPFHGLKYGECPQNCGAAGWECPHNAEAVCDVHGGVTFAAGCEEGADPATGICHVSDRRVWWIGFDCGHAFDLMPSMTEWSSPDQVYRDLPYVISEIEGLAAQLAGVAS